MMSNFREHLITNQQVTTLANEYENKNYSFINAQRSPSSPDSKEYYFEISVLEEYIAFVKQEAGERGYENVGIMVKMGQYPDDNVIDPRQNSEYKGYQVAFLAPFTTDGNSENTIITDIDSLNLVGICPPKF